MSNNRRYRHLWLNLKYLPVRQPSIISVTFSIACLDTVLHSFVPNIPINLTNKTPYLYGTGKHSRISELKVIMQTIVRANCIHSRYPRIPKVVNAGVRNRRLQIFTDSQPSDWLRAPFALFCSFHVLNLTVHVQDSILKYCAVSTLYRLFRASWWGFSRKKGLLKYTLNPRMWLRSERERADWSSARA